MVAETKNLFIFAPAQFSHPDEGAGIAIQDVHPLALESAATGRESRKLGGCLRPLLHDKTPLPDLTAEAHWLIDVLRDFKSLTLTPVPIISNVHVDLVSQTVVVSHTR